jgi:hypothetical protein
VGWGAEAGELMLSAYAYDHEIPIIDNLLGRRCFPGSRPIWKNEVLLFVHSAIGTDDAWKQQKVHAAIDAFLRPRL